MDEISKYLILTVVIVSHMTAAGQTFNDRIPYTIIWQSLTDKCDSSFGISIDVQIYGITINKKTDVPNYENSGDVITILYSGPTLGGWPMVNNDGKITNGGVPQAGNLTLHYQQFEEQLNAQIPNVSFSGLGVIDFEAWPPLWEMAGHKSVYANMSKKLVRDKHPDWSENKTAEQAKQDFENGARIFMEGTLQYAKKMRPKASWGYYGYPRYSYVPSTSELNYKMLWLYEASSALYPSFYLKRNEPNFNHTSRLIQIKALIQDSVELRHNLSRPNLPVFPYVTYIPEALPYYPGVVGDLIATVGQIADSGFNGAIIWRGAGAETDVETCKNTETFMKNIFGPYAKTVLNVTQQCSLLQCNGNGRCSLSSHSGFKPSIYENLRKAVQNAILDFANGIKHVKSISKKINKHDFTNLFECYCFDDWKGQFCDQHI